MLGMQALNETLITVNGAPGCPCSALPALSGLDDWHELADTLTMLLDEMYGAVSEVLSDTSDAAMEHAQDIVKHNIALILGVGYTLGVDATFAELGSFAPSDIGGMSL